MNERLFEIMQRRGIDFLVLCQSDNVAYTTGYDTPLPYNAADNVANMPFSYALIDGREKSVILAATSFGCGDAAEKSFADEVKVFCNFDFFREYDTRAELEKSLDGLLQDRLKSVKKIGIEETRLPVFVYRLIKRFAPDAEVVEVQSLLDEARMVKAPWEIERIRYSCKVEDAGQLKLLDYAKNWHSGMTEFEVYSGILTEMYRVHGERTTVTGDFATGPRIREIAGVKGPLPREIQQGDLGIFDMSTRINGYWCDCSNTVVFGAEPTKEQLYYFRMVQEAFYAGMNELVPGKRLYDVDRATAEVFRAYGREPIVYTGHQIGCHVNEVPRILSYTDRNIVIEPNMVVCLEPQIYSDDAGTTGVRLERVVQVTERGAKPLNEFPWGIE